jgi:hypothetical protein
MPESPGKEDWKAIFEALQRDNYKHKIGLETHIFDGAPIAAAHASMDEILHLVNQL